MKPAVINGIIPPMITPLTGRSELDTDALYRIVEHIAAGKVNGIFLLGSTGEWANLPVETRNQVLIHGIKAVNGRFPVFVNITDTAISEVLRKAAEAEDAGAGYAVIAPPFYYNMTQSELLRFFEMVVEGIGIPLLLYNAPQYTRKIIAPESVAALAMHEKIAGLKESSGNMDYLQRVISMGTPAGFPVLIGPDILLAESIQMGCKGGVCGGANLFPRLYSDLISAVLNGEQVELNRLQGLIRRINAELYHGSGSPLSNIIGLKFAMSLRGLCQFHFSEPVAPELPQYSKKIIERLLDDFKSLGY